MHVVTDTDQIAVTFHTEAAAGALTIEGKGGSSGRVLLTASATRQLYAALQDHRSNAAGGRIGRQARRFWWGPFSNDEVAVVDGVDPPGFPGEPIGGAS